MSKGQYSFNGSYPQDLPDYWKTDDGTIHTDFEQLSDDDLKKLNWFGPIEIPPLQGTSHFTHNYEWNEQTISFDAIELDSFTKEQKVNYIKFWNDLLETSAYEKIKELSSQSLQLNTLSTEFIALISDAKNGYANVNKIQQRLLDIINNIPFTSDELQEIQTVFIESGMFAVYTLS